MAYQEVSTVSFVPLVPNFITPNLITLGMVGVNLLAVTPLAYSIWLYSQFAQLMEPPHFPPA